MNPRIRKAATILLAAVVIYLAAVVAYSLYSTIRTKRQQQTAGNDTADNTATPTSPTTTATTATTTPAYPLKYGSRGDNVRQIQQICLSHSIPVGPTGTDGIWGKNTENAVAQLQNLQITARANTFGILTLPLAALTALGLLPHGNNGTASGTPYRPDIKPVSQPSDTRSHLEIRTSDDLQNIIRINNTLRTT